MRVKKVFPLRPNRHQTHFLIDIIIVSASIYFAIALANSGIISEIVSQTREFIFFESFLAGLFFTSIFTTAPAIAAIGQIARTAPSLWPIVLFGALGALCGDLIIFKFMKDRIYQDVMYVLGERKGLKSLFRAKLFRWFSFFIGGIIIASPLPDEMGVAMMGLSRAGVATFIPVSITFNAVGILLISVAARLI